MENTYYQKQSNDIVTESIDGEVVIININNGSYYSLDGAGAYLWNNLIAGVSLETVVGQLALSFVGFDIGTHANQLVERLLQVELLVRSPEAPSDNGIELRGELPSSGENFALECYTDMQELLMLDPIHEVEESGWPHRQDGSN
ncbi:MAG: PqqD family protein [Verrucomicrobiota bacterium]